MATQYTAGLTSGQVLTAATMNSIGAAWESYTPTWKGGATTITNTITYAKYCRIQKLVIVSVALTATGAGAANGIITCSYPSGLAPANNSSYRPLGTILIHDSGTAFYGGITAVVYDSTTFSGMSYNQVNYIGNAGPTFTIASGDRFEATITYEVA